MTDAELKAAEEKAKKEAEAAKEVSLKEVADAVSAAVGSAVKEAISPLSEVIKSMKAPAIISEQGEKQSFREILVGIKTGNQRVIDKYKLQPATKFFGEDADKKILAEGAGATGGFLVPVEQRNNIINLIKERSIIRLLANVYPMSSRTMTVPVVSGGNTAYWIDENGLKTASDPTFEQMLLTAYKLVVKTLVSDELLADSNPAVDDVLYALFALAMIRGEETAFLRGTGLAGDPITGIYNYAGITTLPASGDLLDDCADLIGAVEEDEGETVTILHALREKRTLRKMKDDDGQYVYQKPADKNTPATIWDANAIGDKYIPTNLGVGVNESFMIGGDFSYAYIGDRQEMVIDVSKERYFEYDQTCFRAVKRVAFRLADASKFARLTGIVPV